MLTVGEKTFLQNVGWNNSILECDYVQTANKVPSCKTNLAEMSRQATVALWHAGGNWGDLWIDAQWPRIESFQELLQTGFTIVGMPQSLYYKDESMQKRQTGMIQKNIQNGLSIVEWDTKNSQTLTRSRLIFTWREEESFERALHLYPFATNKLVPDIAFQLGPYEPIRPEKYKDMVDILLFMRDDNESQMKKDRSRSAVQTLLNSVPGSEGLTFSIVDWNDRLTIFKTTNTLFDSTSIKLLSLGKIVICDRLHVAILAYLSGLPFIYLDQVSNKLTKTLRVAFSSWDGCQDEFGAMFAKAVSLQDALIKAVEFLDKYDLI
jgi:exopolysaccharide biosynthesis predicted pyruvyltransferase EpsI